MDSKILPTENSEIEKAILEGGNHFKTLLENSPTAIQIHATNGVLLQTNKAWENLWGVKAENVIGQFNILEDNQSIALGISQKVTRALTGESTTIPDFTFDPAESGYPGRKHWARSRIFPLLDKNSTVQKIIITHEDITSFKQTEERYQIVIENANEAIMVVQDGLLKFFNQKALDIAGYTSEEDYAGRSFTDFVHPDYRDMVLERHNRRVDGETVPNFYQIQILHKSGHPLWLQLNVTRIEWEGKPASFAFIFDITDFKKSEAELDKYRHNLEELVGERTSEIKEKNRDLIKEIEERHKAERALHKNEITLKNAHSNLQSIIDGISESIVVIDLSYKIKMINKSARELYLLKSEDQPLYCYQLNHQKDKPCSSPDHNCPLDMILKTKKPYAVTHVHNIPGRPKRTVELLASPIFDDQGEVTGLIEVGRDITERIILEEEKKKLQLRLFEQQKGESITTLAGGVAHDFNNILMSVLGSAELLQRKMHKEHDCQKYAELIIVAVHRMTNLTRQLLAYAKGGNYQPEILSLNAIVKESLALSHMGKGAGMDSSIDLAENLWPVFADPGQMGQMFVNLFTNAFEAMEDSGGKLSVETSNVTKIEGWEDFFHKEHSPGSYVCIKITDTGAGIPEDVKKRIFEPFFTTKFVGRGLGLAAVAGIAQNHGGSILLESGPNEGTTFSILLRRATTIEIEAQELEHSEEPNKSYLGKILIIDDDPQVVEIIDNILQSQGYDVLTADGGHTALQMMRTFKKNIALVILDIQMPDMNGSEVFKGLKKMKSNINVLISSGYDKKKALTEIFLDPNDDFIQKPFEINMLLEKVTNIIG